MYCIRTNSWFTVSKICTILADPWSGLLSILLWCGTRLTWCLRQATPAEPGDTGTTGTAASPRNLFSRSYPLGKGCGPSFEQTWFPITQECFMLNLVEIVKKFPRRWFLNAVCVFSPFHYYHSLIEKGWCVALHFNALVPHLLRMFCIKFDWKWLTGSEEEDRNVKRLRTDGWTEVGQQTIIKAHLSFQLRSDIRKRMHHNITLPWLASQNLNDIIKHFYII